MNEPKRSPIAPKIIFLASAAFIAVLLIIGFSIAIYNYSTKINWIPHELAEVEYPIKGNHLSIKSVSSGWIPVIDEEASEEETEYIPSAQITLSKDSAAGKMRCFYLDGNGKYVGDPITLDCQVGQFSDSDTVTFTCSQGIGQSSDFFAYQSGFVKEWYLLILEGDSDSASINDYKELTRIKLRPHILAQ